VSVSAGVCSWSPSGAPRRFDELLNDPDFGRARRAMDAMLQMGKIDVAELERAADSAPMSEG
jgi:hypothetical protein